VKARPLDETGDPSHIVQDTPEISVAAELTEIGIDGLKRYSSLTPRKTEVGESSDPVSKNRSNAVDGIPYLIGTNNLASAVFPTLRGSLYSPSALEVMVVIMTLMRQQQGWTHPKSQSGWESFILSRVRVN
jgi:hypothetical protein